MSARANPTYQELRRPTRLGTFTAAQHAQLAVSGVLAIAGGLGLTALGLPVGPALSAVVLIAGAPVVLALVTEGLEFSALGVIVLLARRARTPKRYGPGGPVADGGYHVAEAPPRATRRAMRAGRAAATAEEAT